MKDDVDHRELVHCAEDVILAWDAWCEAEGWDNSEYDNFSAALNDLQALLKTRTVPD